MSTSDQLLSQLREAIKAEVREEVRLELIAELGGARTQPTKKAKGKPGPKPKPPKSTGPDGSEVLKVRKGVRRTAEDLEQAAKVLKLWFSKNPGSRVDQASAALGVPVKDLQRPVQFLLEGKQLAKKGKLRGTTYTVKG